jgi:hypothetical protein
MATRNTLKSVIGPDGGTILDIRQGLQLYVNSTGARIWQLLDQGRSDQEICEAISREFKAPLEVVQRDVAEYISALRAQKVVE